MPWHTWHWFPPFPVMVVNEGVYRGPRAIQKSRWWWLQIWTTWPKASSEGHKLMGASRVCDSKTKGTKASTKAWLKSWDRMNDFQVTFLEFAYLVWSQNARHKQPSIIFNHQFRGAQVKRFDKAVHKQPVFFSCLMVVPQFQQSTHQSDHISLRQFFSIGPPRQFIANCILGWNYCFKHSKQGWNTLVYLWLQLIRWWNLQSIMKTNFLKSHGKKTRIITDHMQRVCRNSTIWPC